MIFNVLEKGLSFEDLWFFQVIIISFLLVLLMTVKMVFSTYFSKKFFLLLVLLLSMVFFSINCFFSIDIFYTFIGLMHLSFYSAYLVSVGYGPGYKVMIILFFKLMADVSILLCFGFNLFYFCESQIELYGVLFEYNLVFSTLLAISFLVYSLVGLFGFWMYQAMDASYFISCYLHSCGFMAIGVVLFNSLNYFGFFKNLIILTYLIGMMSLVSFMIFMLFFLNVEDMKKSFGFFSASSICYLFLFTMMSPTLAVFYFTTSSLVKIIFFEVLSYLFKSDSEKKSKLVFMFMFLIVNLLGYNYMSYIMANSSEFEVLSSVLIFIFHMKLLCVFIFSIKLLNWFKFNNMTCTVLILMVLAFQVVTFFYIHSFLKFEYNFFILQYIGFTYLFYIFFKSFNIETLNLHFKMLSIIENIQFKIMSYNFFSYLTNFKLYLFSLMSFVIYFLDNKFLVTDKDHSGVSLMFGIFFFILLILMF